MYIICKEQPCSFVPALTASDFLQDYFITTEITLLGADLDKGTDPGYFRTPIYFLNQSLSSMMQRCILAAFSILNIN